MKPRLAIFAILLALAATGEGCKPSSPPVPVTPVPSNPPPLVAPQASPASSTPETASLLPPNTPPAPSATDTAPMPATTTDSKDVANAKRADYLRAAQAQLNAVNSEINAIDVQVNSHIKDPVAKGAAQAKIDALRAQSQNLKTQLGNAPTASASTWDDFKTRAEKIYADLKDSTAATNQWLGDYLTRNPF